MSEPARPQLITVGIEPLEDRGEHTVTLPRPVDAAATRELVERLAAAHRVAPVLIIHPDWIAGPERDHLRLALAAAEHGRVGVHATSLPPLAARVLVTQARTLLDAGAAGWALAALARLERSYTAFAVVTGLTGLHHPPPRFGQHLTSLLPGTVFAAFTHPRPSVVRIRGARQWNPPAPSGPAAAVLAAASGGVTRLRGALDDAIGTPVTEVEPDPADAAYWGSARYTEIAWHPRLTDGALAGLHAAIALRTCSWCGGRVSGRPCAFCGMSAGAWSAA